MIAPSTTHLVLVPSFNPGRKVYDTIARAREQWAPVWVVIDGSTDGTAEGLERMAAGDPQLRVIRLERNCGKGAAVLRGLELARQLGFTHALTLDSDGQHPTDQIPAFMAASLASPNAMILGDPVFDATAPSIRVKGRRISNWWVNLETLWAGIHDSLFGFRVYPIDELVRIMQHEIWMRRFDFDVEAAVRLSWSGVPAINLPAAVRYFRPDEDGVSHFNYVRDNALLTWMHARLLLGFLLRLPVLLLRSRSEAGTERLPSR